MKKDTRIRYILPGFFFALYLSSGMGHLNELPLGEHSWKQFDDLCIAREYSIGARFFYPQVPWGGPGGGTIGSEFPIYTYLVGALWRIAGENVFIPRILCLVFTSLTAAILCLLAIDLFGIVAAIFTSLAFIFCPLNYYFGKAISIEPLMILTSVASFYFFLRCRLDPNRNSLVAAVFLLSLTALLKLPNLFLLLPALIVLKGKDDIYSLIKKPCLYAILLVVITPAFFWYRHAFWIADNMEPGVIFGRDLWFRFDMLLKPGFYLQVFDLVNRKGLTPAGLILMIIGILPFSKPNNEFGFKIVRYWLLGFMVYLIIGAKGCFIHTYYFLPLIPPACLAIGIGAERLWNLQKQAKVNIVLRVMVILAFGTLIYKGAVRGERWFDIQQDKQHVFDAAYFAKEFIPKDSAVALLEYPRLTNIPAFFYLSDTSGMVFTPENFKPEQLIELAALGYEYLVAAIQQGKSSQFKNEPLFSGLNERLDFVAQCHGAYIYKLK